MQKGIDLHAGVNLVPVKLSSSNADLYIVTLYVEGKQYSKKLLKGK